ncbi:MAG: T9SS type A sorting domain-containing protein [Bacteroidia bacterium]
MKQILLILWLCVATGLSAQINRALNELVIPLTAKVEENPAVIELHWEHSTAQGTGYTIYKKRQQDLIWGLIAQTSETDSSLRDGAVQEGEVYEYRIFKNGPGGVVSWGYTSSGIRHMPWLLNRGLLLVLDTSVTDSLGYELDRLKKDLVAEGYIVTEIKTHRDETVVDVKEKIIAAYNNPRIDYTSAIVLGHVPVPYSGNLYPDAHPDHQGAWPTDLFYADIDGNWTDRLVNNDGAGDPRNDNIPRDGKYDNSTVPSSLELEIGRIDFHSMSQLAESEVELLRKYLDKNHAFRNKNYVPRRRGLMDEGSFGGSGADEGFGQSAPRAMIPLLGRDSFFLADYFSTMDSASYLWSYGQGAGSYTSCAQVGTTRDFDTIEVQSVFTMLFGSYFGDYDKSNNLMRASLGSGKILTCSWSSSRPVWYYHHMAMGYPIGFSAKRSVNKENLYAAINFGAGFPTNQGVHNVLLGDPTLRPFYVKGPGRLSPYPLDTGRVQLSWSIAQDDVIGYNMYRSMMDSSHYIKVNDSLITGERYIDSAASGNYRYMVRAVRLEVTASGSYLNESPGVFENALIRNTVGVDPMLSQQLVIFPNPAGERLFVKTELSLNRLTVSDLQGRIVLSQQGYEAGGIDLSALPEGVYLILLETGQGQIWKRFVKQ